MNFLCFMQITAADRYVNEKIHLKSGLIAKPEHAQPDRCHPGKDLRQAA